MVNSGDLILFTQNEKYSKDFIIKQIGLQKFEDSIEKGFFIETSDNKFIFTEIGKKFAWN